MVMIILVYLCDEHAKMLNESGLKLRLSVVYAPDELCAETDCVERITTHCEIHISHREVE